MPRPATSRPPGHIPAQSSLVAESMLQAAFAAWLTAIRHDLQHAETAHIEPHPPHGELLHGQRQPRRDRVFRFSLARHCQTPHVTGKGGTAQQEKKLASAARSQEKQLQGRHGLSDPAAAGQKLTQRTDTPVSGARQSEQHTQKEANRPDHMYGHDDGDEGCDEGVRAERVDGGRRVNGYGHSARQSRSSCSKAGGRIRHGSSPGLQQAHHKSGNQQLQSPEIQSSASQSETSAEDSVTTNDQEYPAASLKDRPQEQAGRVDQERGGHLPRQSPGRDDEALQSRTYGRGSGSKTGESGKIRQQKRGSVQVSAPWADSSLVDSMLEHEDEHMQQSMGRDTFEGPRGMIAERTEEWVQDVSSEASGYASEWAAELAGLTPTSVPTPLATASHPDAWLHQQLRPTERVTSPQPENPVGRRSNDKHKDGKQRTHGNVASGEESKVAAALRRRHKSEQANQQHPHLEARGNLVPHASHGLESFPDSSNLPRHHAHWSLKDHQDIMHGGPSAYGAREYPMDRRAPPTPTPTPVVGGFRTASSYSRASSNMENSPGQRIGRDEAHARGTADYPTPRPAGPAALSTEPLDSTHTPIQPIPATDAAGGYSSLHSLADIGRRLSALRIGRQRTSPLHASPTPLRSSQAGSFPLHSSSPAALRRGIEPGLSFDDLSSKVLPVYDHSHLAGGSRRLAPHSRHRHGPDRNPDETDATAEGVSGMAFQAGHRDEPTGHANVPIYHLGGSYGAEYEQRAQNHAHAPPRSFLKRSTSKSAERAKLETNTPASHLLRSGAARRHSHEHLARPQTDHIREVHASPHRAAPAAAARQQYKEPIQAPISRASPLPQRAHAQAAFSHSQVEERVPEREQPSPLHARPWGWRGSKHAANAAGQDERLSPRAPSSEGCRSRHSSPATSYAGSPAKHAGAVLSHQQLSSRHVNHQASSRSPRHGDLWKVREHGPAQDSHARTTQDARPGAAHDMRDGVHQAERRRHGMPASRLSRASHSTFESEAALLGSRTATLEQKSVRSQSNAILLGVERLVEKPRAAQQDASKPSLTPEHDPHSPGNLAPAERRRGSRKSLAQGGHGSPIPKSLEPGGPSHGSRNPDRLEPGGPSHSSRGHMAHHDDLRQESHHGSTPEFGAGLGSSLHSGYAPWPLDTACAV